MTTATAAKRRVLVVDDEENVTHLVSSALRFDGFETVTRRQWPVRPRRCRGRRIRIS